MFRRILLGVVLGLSLSACVPYYVEPGYYRTDVYAVPGPYYYGGYVLFLRHLVIAGYAWFVNLETADGRNGYGTMKVELFRDVCVSCDSSDVAVTCHLFYVTKKLA